MRRQQQSSWNRSESLESRLFLTAAPWTSLGKVPAAKGLTSDLQLSSYRPYTIDSRTLGTTLDAASDENIAKYGVGHGAKAVLVSVPRPDGSLQRFRVVQSDILTGATEKKYGSVIQTYTGYGVDDPSASVRLDMTPLGFHAQVITSTGGGSYAVDPYYTSGTSVYASYYARNATVKGAVADTGSDLIVAKAKSAIAAAAATTAARTSGTALRTYRTAVACTGEYATYQGGTVAKALAAIVTTMNRVTGVYETELSIRLTLVSNESSLVYTNSSTDPYTNTNSSSLLTQNQKTVDSIIGTANYDIGHVFSTAGGGLASLGVVGNATYKAQGETGTSAPVGDAFDIDYVAHEMGHQFGANHTFNTSNDTGNRNATTAFEPGSGSTIMAYAGIEGSATYNNVTGTEDLQAHSDPYFAFVSLNEILTYVDVSIPNVGTRTATGNTAPTASNTTVTYTIPANTPFTLTSPTASDANGDTIYYSWEEADAGTATYLTQPDGTTTTSTTAALNAPLFRVYNPTTSPSRNFPQLASVLNGTNITYVSGSTTSRAEQLPLTSRAMRFVLTLRDQKAGGGGTTVLSGTGTGVSTATITPTATVTSVAAATGFAVSNFNTATTVAGGSNQTITWNVAGTTANGINTSAVNILMSTDGGQTFTIPLASGTANDGTETVTLPYNTASSQVRFKVAAVGNIYYDINNANLTITSVSPVSAAPGAPVLAAASDTGISSSDGLTNRNNATSGTTLQFSVPNTVAGALVTIYSDGTAIGTATATGTTTVVTTNGTTAVADGTHALTARQTETGKTISAVSAASALTVDTSAPAAGTPTFSFLTTKPQVGFTFSQPIANVSGASFTVTNLDTGATVVATTTATSDGTGVTLTFPTAPNGILPDGNYTATANTAALTDAAGNAATGSATLTFFVLAGDANRDRVVDFNDYLLLQNGFNKPGDFSTGDFDYNGVVDFYDYLILQNNFTHAV